MPHDGRTKNKQRGEWAELCFMARAADRGLNVSRPHGDSASYDVGVEQNGRFLRIQVKSTVTQGRSGGYKCDITGGSKQRYAQGTIDFFAVYLVPIDMWYIIPFVVAETNVTLYLTPRKGYKFAQYMKRGICCVVRKKRREKGRWLTTHRQLTRRSGDRPCRFKDLNIKIPTLISQKARN